MFKDAGGGREQGRKCENLPEPLRKTKSSWARSAFTLAARKEKGVTGASTGCKPVAKERLNMNTWEIGRAIQFIDCQMRFTWG